jgi:DnaJ family protein C protein 13
VKVVKALKREDEGVTHAAIDMVCALMHPMHDNYDLRQEQLNKSSLLSSSKFLESLLTMWISHVVSPKDYWNSTLTHWCLPATHGNADG